MLARICRKRNPFALLVGRQTSAATVKSSMEIPQKIKNGSAFWPSDPTSGNISKETQNTNLKNISTPMFIAALFTITKIRKQPKWPSVHEWIKQLRDIYTIEHSSALIKEKICSPYPWFCLCSSCLLTLFFDSIVDRYVFIAILLFIVFIFFFFNKSF